MKPSARFQTLKCYVSSEKIKNLFCNVLFQTSGFATVCELQEQLQGLMMATDVRAELPPVDLSISFTQVSMDAVIQCRMSEGKSVELIIFI